MMFGSEIHVFVALCVAGITCGSNVSIRNLMDDTAQQFSSYHDTDRQEFVDTFSKLIVHEILQKASKAVQLQDEYQRLRYGLKYGIKAIALISLEDGVTSKPTFKFVNATIVNYASNHIEFNTRVSFGNLRLSYSKCKLNISGTRQSGMLSAKVDNFEGVFSTIIDFRESGWKWARRSKTVYGNIRATTNPTVKLDSLRILEGSRDMFVIYANMVHPDDLQEIFRRQMIHVFDVVILEHVDQLYNYLKTITHQRTTTMLYEAIMKAAGKMSKKVYRFNEENIDPHDIPTTLGDINTLSDLFDAFIVEARHNMMAENLDPLEIPDGVHKELNALIMSATLDINRISVHNLSNLTRLKPFVCHYQDRMMTISIPINFVDVKVFTDYKINAGYVVISEGRIMGKAGDISLFLTFAFDFLQKKMIFKEFGIPNCDKLAVVFKGDGLSKYLLNVLTPIVIMSFKTILLATIKTKVSEEITKGMEIVNRIIAEIEESKQKRPEEIPTTSNL